MKWLVVWLPYWTVRFEHFFVFSTAKYRAKGKVRDFAGAVCDGRKVAKNCAKSEITGRVAKLKHFAAQSAFLPVYTVFNGSTQVNNYNTVVCCG